MKNPSMSIFLSNANRVAGTIRRQAIATVKRETEKNAKEMTKAWTDALVSPVLARPRASKKITTRK